jgi:hypothetical protein
VEEFTNLLTYEIPALPPQPAAIPIPFPVPAGITKGRKTEITGLKNRVVESTSTINELTEFQTQALARLAAQHDEIIRLRAAATSASRVSRLPQRAATIGSCN